MHCQPSQAPVQELGRPQAHHTTHVRVQLQISCCIRRHSSLSHHHAAAAATIFTALLTTHRSPLKRGRSPSSPAQGDKRKTGLRRGDKAVENGKVRVADACMHSVPAVASTVLPLTHLCCFCVHNNVSPHTQDKPAAAEGSGRKSSPAGAAAPAAARDKSPPPTKLHVSKLTRNVTAEHVSEIFSTYGTLVACTLAVDQQVQLPKGYAVVEFASAEEAERAKDYMDGAQLDGNVLQ